MSSIFNQQDLIGSYCKKLEVSEYNVTWELFPTCRPTEELRQQMLLSKPFGKVRITTDRRFLWPIILGLIVNASEQ